MNYILGVDRSHLNDPVKLSSLYDKGIRLIFFEAIKSNGEQDQNFNASWQEAKDIPGLYRGAYAMFDPRKDGKLQAQNLLAIGIGHSKPYCLGLWVDVEDLVVFGADDKIDQRATDEANKWVADNWQLCLQRLNDFLFEIKQTTGVECGIYSYNNYMREYYHSTPFPNNPMWLSSLQPTCPARYDTSLFPEFWQWTYGWENTDMDGDYFTGTQQDLDKLANIQS